MGFQTSVRTRQAPAIQGDFASDAPRNFYVAGPGGLVAGSSGLVVGRAAWVSQSSIDWDSGASVANNSGYGSIAGIVPRRLGQALITTFLADNGMTIPQGSPVALLTAGDIWLKNDGATQCQQGMKAYASLATGAFSFGWTGAPTAAASAATASIAAGTAATSAGSTISGNVLTTGASVSNTIYPGAIVTGGTVAAGTYIVAQLSGTTGGAGTYAVSIPEQSVASATLTITPSVYTPGTMQAGTVAVGAVIIASGGGYTTTAATTGAIAGMAVMAAIAAGTTWSLAPAPGLTAAGTLTSGTVVTESTVETKWYAANSATAGELVKCYSQALG